MSKKMANGKRVEKVVSNWRILNKLEKMGALLFMNLTWHFKHIRREANKVSNLLTNVGVGGGHHIFEGKLQYFEGTEWIDQCRHLANVDHVASRREGGAE